MRQETFTLRQKEFQGVNVITGGMSLKRVLWICASILAGLKLAEIKAAKKEVTYDAILKAERIMGQD
jgi:hypothetical protein